MFISQKKAKDLLREEAGFTIKAARAEVSKLPKTTFEKREKVKLADIENIIRNAKAPTPVPPVILTKRQMKRRERTRRLLGLPI